MDEELQAILDDNALADFTPRSLSGLAGPSLRRVHAAVMDLGVQRRDALLAARKEHAADSPEVGDRSRALASVFDAAHNSLGAMENCPDVVLEAVEGLFDDAPPIAASSATPAPNVPVRTRPRRPDLGVRPRNNGGGVVIRASASGQLLHGWAAARDVLADAIGSASRGTEMHNRLVAIESNAPITRLSADEHANESLIADGVSDLRRAIKASGGQCSPTEVVYSQPVFRPRCGPCATACRDSAHRAAASACCRPRRCPTWRPVLASGR